MTGTDEKWSRIESTLRTGRRGGLPPGSSLPKLLTEHRGVQNFLDVPPLTVEEILAWADEHKASTGDWPKVKSGPVADTDEMWAGVNSALSRGKRGLPGGSSLAKLLKQ